MITAVTLTVDVNRQRPKGRMRLVGEVETSSVTGHMNQQSPPRRRGRRERPSGPIAPPQPDWHLHRRAFAPTAVISEDELESIHDSSLLVLRDIGMDFLHPKATEILAAAGADVDGERVRFDPEMVTELIRTAPSKFVIHAPNPAHDLVIGGDSVVFGSVASAPNVVTAKAVGVPVTVSISVISSGWRSASTRCKPMVAIRLSRSTSTPRYAIWKRFEIF